MPTASSYRSLRGPGLLRHPIPRWGALLASLSLFVGFSRPAIGSDAEAAHSPIGNAWSDSRNPVTQRFGGARLDLWSLRPIPSAAVPDPVGDAPAVTHPIDRFIAARLSSQRLQFNPRADLRTLARRASFQLVGLPPNPQRLRELLSDDRPDAFARYVDELLASPRYGEHWARLWLDVVRYSDSNGFDWDEFRPQAWRFRDYVVASLNADKPFDQFLLEQLAGDELLAGPPKTAEEQQALLATSFLRLGPHDNAAVLFNEQDRSRAELLADLTETTGSAFLGLTLSCCRCHDHKTDPLLQADHFRLRAFFEGVRPADDLAIDLAPVQQEIDTHNRQLDLERAEVSRRQDQLLAAVRERLNREGQANPSPADIEQALTEAERQEQQQLVSRGKQLDGQKRNPQFALLMTDAPGEIAPTRILYQGDHRTPRDQVEPGFPMLFDPSAAVIARGVNPTTSGRRLTLARWIADPANPLTRRVVVNRVWQALFGQGLVATPNDFGLSGVPPTHPELLDWLANEFLRGGWSLKSLQRQIVLSTTWQQTSQVTPETQVQDAGNEWLARQNTRRLSAEQLRDALLAASGLLTDKHSGPPIWPDLPAEILQANPAFLDDNETRTKGWYPSPAAEQHCRSLYLVQKRGVKVPFLETFDLPENMVSCGRRNASTVAPQALSLLNSDLAFSAALGLAKRVTQSAGADHRRQIETLFDLALQRPATAEEQRECQEYLADYSLAELCRAILNLNEFAYLD
jgi:hypothetical protein